MKTSLSFKIICFTERQWARLVIESTVLLLPTHSTTNFLPTRHPMLHLPNAIQHSTESNNQWHCLIEILLPKLHTSSLFHIYFFPQFFFNPNSFFFPLLLLFYSTHYRLPKTQLNRSFASSPSSHFFSPSMPLLSSYLHEHNSNFVRFTSLFTHML